MESNHLKESLLFLILFLIVFSSPFFSFEKFLRLKTKIVPLFYGRWHGNGNDEDKWDSSRTVPLEREEKRRGRRKWKRGKSLFPPMVSQDFSFPMRDEEEWIKTSVKTNKKGKEQQQIPQTSRTDSFSSCPSHREVLSEESNFFFYRPTDHYPDAFLSSLPPSQPSHIFL